MRTTFDYQRGSFDPHQMVARLHTHAEEWSHAQGREAIRAEPRGGPHGTAERASGADGARAQVRVPANGMDADVAYQLIHDELLLDCSARLNLATFVTTWMEPQAEKPR
jgi:hypothetical protein